MTRKAHTLQKSTIRKASPKQNANKLRVAVLCGSEVVATGRLVTVDEIMRFGRGELSVTFLPDDSEPVQAFARSS